MRLCIGLQEHCCRKASNFLGDEEAGNTEEKQPDAQKMDSRTAHRYFYAQQSTSSME